MITRKFGLGLFLAVSLAWGPQFHAAGQTPAPNKQCEAAQAAYANHRAACSDVQQQLSSLRVQLGELESQRDALERQCKEARSTTGGNTAACDQLAELQAGRLSTLQTDYNNLAQRGCQETSPSTLLKSCTAGPAAGANQSKSKSGSTNSAQSGNTISTPKSSGQPQVSRQNSGNSAAGPRQTSVGASNGANGDGFSGRSNSMGSSPSPSMSSPAAGVSRPK